MQPPYVLQIAIIQMSNDLNDEVHGDCDIHAQNIKFPSMYYNDTLLQYALSLMVAY